MTAPTNDEENMATAIALDRTAPRRRRRVSTLLATASMASWLILGAMPIVAAIIALT